jgi:hypothetical protein
MNGVLREAFAECSLALEMNDEEMAVRYVDETVLLNRIDGDDASTGIADLLATTVEQLNRVAHVSAQ